MTTRRPIIFALACAFIAGAGPPAAHAATQPPDAKTHAAWHRTMTALDVPQKGCFKAAFPRVAWRKVACATPPDVPYVPRMGPRPFSVGNANDFSAVVTGAMTAAEGSFDSVSGVTSETAPWRGATTADSYSLQLNTAPFITSACGTSNPGCRGWQQFVYSSDAGQIFIQYWLLKYNAPCPGGWNTFSFAGSTDIYCWRNSASGATIGRQPVTSLASLKLGAVANAGGNDSVNMFVGATSATASSAGSLLNLGAAWNQAEFIIAGDGNSSEASFNTGSSISVRTTVHNGTRSAPGCMKGGFTGETNNLNLVGTPAVGTGPSPAIVSRQTSSTSAMSSCASANGYGDTHLTTFNGLLYDFQAQGDFVLADRPGFQVQARQVSGAPTWPNAAVNQAVGTRMGNTTVSVCLPDQLFVDGKPTTVTPDSPLVLADGVDVSHSGNAYLIRGPEGDSVRAQVNAGYVDVSVGLGADPAGVRGLLANANGNVNDVATSAGAVLTWPLAFGTLYGPFGDGWRVKAGDSVLCGQPVKPTDPKQPFSVRDLPDDVAQRARAVCTKARVKEGPLFDACTLDVAVLGRADAAKVYVGAPDPVAVGTPGE